LPVFAFFFLEYSRYSPLFNFRIMRPLALTQKMFCRGPIDALCESGWLFLRRCGETRCHVFSPPIELASTENCETPPSDLPSSAPGSSRATALTISSGNATALVRNRVPLSALYGPKSCPCAEVPALRPTFAPSTSRSRSPASWTPLRAFLLEYGAFPRVRILRPACSAIFLRARLRELAQSFLVPAW
jgi:hypothetical protein